MATRAEQELDKAESRTRRRVNAALALWSLWPKRIGSQALTEALIESRVAARVAGAKVAIAQLRLDRVAETIEATAHDEARAVSATRAYKARILEEAKEAETLREARREAKPAIDRIIASETASALNEGIADEGRRIQEETGIELEKVWRAEGDACEECAGLDGNAVDVNDDFPDGEPGSIHPNCRCTTEIRRKT